MKFGSPASMAGLPGNKAWVNVGPPLFCNGPKHRIGIDLVAWAVQKTAAIIATDIVAMSDKAAAIIKNVDARGACF